MEEILEIYWSSWDLLPERIVHFASLSSGRLCLQFIENPKIKKQEYLYRKNIIKIKLLRNLR